MRLQSPPTLLARTLTLTLVGVALLMSLVFIVLSIHTRRQVRQNVAATLDSTQRVVAELEALRQRQVRTQAAVLADSASLAAAVHAASPPADAPAASGADTADAAGRRAAARAAVSSELQRLAAHVSADVVAVVDRDGQTLTTTGAGAGAWSAGSGAPPAGHAADAEGIVHLGTRVYRSERVDLRHEGRTVGHLIVSRSLDDGYAAELARASNAQIVVVDGDRVVASTLPSTAIGDFGRAAARALPTDGTVALGGESFAFRRLATAGDVTFYALGSVDGLSEHATVSALRTLALVALAVTAVALAGGVWLARTIARPIRELSQSLEDLSATPDVRAQLSASGSSRELDALTDTFNHLMLSLACAERATDEAYTGAIRALAAALDARDPYTAGHSERVSALSVAIGRTLQVSDADLEVLRLGALLHDIGKIGVPDAVLRKPGPLTDVERAQVRRHPLLGARILRSVPFLAPHVPIVELHHERPDGAGYPYGLRSDATPLVARIVHVADAYDAMTSARAYRAARSDAEAVAELWRYAGSEFDAEIVEALVQSPRALARPERHDAIRPPLPAPHAEPDPRSLAALA